jgi:hypothetical protein
VNVSKRCIGRDVPEASSTLVSPRKTPTSASSPSTALVVDALQREQHRCEPRVVGVVGDLGVRRRRERREPHGVVGQRGDERRLADRTASRVVVVTPKTVADAAVWTALGNGLVQAGSEGVCA